MRILIFGWTIIFNKNVMQRLETYSRQNAQMGWINEESHRIKTYNINVLKGHFFCVVYVTV